MNENNETKELSQEALKAGDRAEFARLVDAFSPAIYRVALKILSDPQDAEDVLQDTFIKAFHALPDFEGRSSLSTWLYRIAVNEALMLLRKRRGQVVSIDPPLEEDDGNDSPLQLTDWCCLPENELLSTEARQFLDQAIQKLPETLSVVFILRDIEGLSIRETAELLGLTESAVKTRLLRARMRLREELSTYYGERIKERSSE
ncbi:MAG TPA: sigma-70 family RNA polymerase sigma factor [Anaerolineaceae bacterium]|nr:sigma-70 family RNA polymerase sigma factor [Anaerolineaceae bacterium]